MTFSINGYEVSDYIIRDNVTGDTVEIIAATDFDSACKWARDNYGIVGTPQTQPGGYMVIGK